MKKIALLFLFLGIKTLAQTHYAKGYFINESNEKFDCLIKNIDWKDNPTSFKYKLNSSSESQKKSIKIVKEFGIYNHVKFLKATS